MDFEEYVSANYKRLEGQTRELVEDAFKAGQQSKQEEVNKLQAEIDKLQVQLDQLQEEIDKRFSDYQLEVSQVGQSCVKWKEMAEGKQAEIDVLENKIQTAINRAYMLQNSSGERIYTELKEILE